jgi:uncharacterized protein with von Willebrand factor type A (vWA) domain
VGTARWSITSTARSTAWRCGVIEVLEEGRGLVLGPAWRHDCGLAAGDTVHVMLQTDGRQRDGLAAGLAAAVAATPEAAAFFDSIAQFYRRAYLRYIDATKRRPEERTARIAQRASPRSSHCSRLASSSGPAPDGESLGPAAKRAKVGVGRRGRLPAGSREHRSVSS